MAKFSIDLKSGTLEDHQQAEKSEEVELIIGIDLGTTNSIVAYVDEGNPKPVLDLSDESVLMPSIIHFDRENNILVGNKAKEELITAPDRTIFSIKRLTGKTYEDISKIADYLAYEIINEDEDSLVKVKVGDRFYNPIELSAHILKALKLRIESQLDREVSKAVITVPAYFNDSQRQATRDAGKLAGLNVLRIINEPTAASLAYGLEYKKNEGETIAVYDLGGGTFDLSLLRIDKGIFEVLASNGDTFLGGDDFDRAIVNYWTEKYNIKDSNNAALRLNAEQAKILINRQNVVSLPYKDITLELDRETYNSLIAPIIDKTLNYCKQALSDAKLSVNDLDHVLMVGGSTRSNLVREKVSEFFNQQVNTSLDPDQVVALGAAIQADILAGNNNEFLLLDITPLSLGIETMGGLMDVIIPRNSKIPTSIGRQYTTSLDGQKNLKISVFQGERDLVVDNRKLGEFILRNIPPMPAGIPKIEISFMINADGILQVKAKELRSDTQQSIEIRPQYGIDEEEMAMMLKDSIVNAEKDMKQRALLEAQNEALNVIQSTERFLVQNKDNFDNQELSHLKKLSDQLSLKREEGTKDEIQDAMHQLNEYAQPLAHKAMDLTISQAIKGTHVNSED